MSEIEDLNKNSSPYTDEQKNFIFYEGKNSIIFSATAGSGKTFSSVERLKELLKRGVDPRKIIFFSFTNAAVEELKERVNNEDIKITTIHSFCFWMLHKMGKSKKIASFSDFINWYKIKNQPSKYAKEKERIKFEKLISNLNDDSDFIDSNISAYKLQLADGIKSKVPVYYNEYSEFLEEEKRRDFSDILIDVRELLKEDKWLRMFKDKYIHLFVDEYQDTSAIQMEILMRLNAKQYYLVGDLNQSIYGYSGSNCSQIESFLEKRRKVERMTLSINFRSGKKIVSNSNKFSSIEAVPFHTFEGEIDEKFIDFNKLIELVNNEEEVVILARTNYIVKLIELKLLKRKIPMKYNNYLNKKDIEEIKKGKESLLVTKKLDYILKEFNDDKEELIKFIEDNQNKKSFTTTVHRSKGKEFDTCVVVNSIPEELIENNNIIIPENKKEKYTFLPGTDSYTEEKNIHYVAVSRPKRMLYYMLIMSEK